MENKFKLDVGDPSGDGHSQSDYYIIKSNKTMEEVGDAYNKSCLSTGLVFTSKTPIIVEGKELKYGDSEYYSRMICAEYEQYNPSNLARDILKGMGIVDTVINGSAYKLTILFLEFIKLSLPDFEYEILINDVPSLELTIGYGLFD